MFSAEATQTTLEEDWEGKWFTIVARLCPNKLAFHGVRLDGWETEDTQSVRVALALPRDGGLTPYVSLCIFDIDTDKAQGSSRLLSGSDKSTPWPGSSAHVSFTGPVDMDTFRLKDDAWSEAQVKTSAFIRLGTYLMPEENRSPHKGVHVCHVLLVFSVEQQPWKSLLGWMLQGANPFPRGSWMSCSGRVLGVLNRELLQGPQVLDSTVRILVVLPDDWEFIRQDALAARSPSVSASSNPIREPPTLPRPAGPGGVASWNPFSSPARQKTSVQKKSTYQKPPSQPVQTANEISAGVQDNPDSTKGKGVEVVPSHAIPPSGRIYSFLVCHSS